MFQMKKQSSLRTLGTTNESTPIATKSPKDQMLLSCESNGGYFSKKKQCFSMNSSRLFNDREYKTPMNNKTSYTIDKVKYFKTKLNDEKNLFPKLTKKKIANELLKMHTFIDNNVKSKIKKNDTKQSALKKAMAFTERNEQLLDQQRKKSGKKIDKTSSDYKNYINNRTNPSICPQLVNKKFPMLSKMGFVKYKNNYIKSYHTKSMSTSIVAFKKTKEENDNSNQYDSKNKNKLPYATIYKLRCKTIKWFMEQHKDIIERLLDSYIQDEMLLYAKKKYKDHKRGLTYDEFASFLQKNGVTNNNTIIRKLYWIMDENGNDQVEYKEIISGLEMFRVSSPEERAKVFFKLCDTDHNNSVSREKFFKVVNNSLINHDYQPALRKLINKIFNEFDTDGSGVLSLEEIINGFKKNKELAELINKNSYEVKALADVIERDIDKDLRKFNPNLDNGLKQKLFGYKCEFYPSKSVSFMKMLKEYINTKENLTLHKEKVLNFQKEYCSNDNNNNDQEEESNDDSPKSYLNNNKKGSIR